MTDFIIKKLPYDLTSNAGPAENYALQRSLEPSKPMPTAAGEARVAWRRKARPYLDKLIELEFRT